MILLRRLCRPILYRTLGVSSPAGNTGHSRLKNEVTDSFVLANDGSSLLTSEAASTSSGKAAELLKALATAKRLVEISYEAWKPFGTAPNPTSLCQDRMRTHAAEKTLKTLQLIMENHDQVSQKDLLIIVEAVVDVRAKSLGKIFSLSFLKGERERIDEMIKNLFLLC